MMTTPQTKAEIVEQLARIQRGLADTVQAIPEGRLEDGTDESWSAADYVKHLILSVKPIAKALTFPRDILRRRFGEATAPSRTYDEIVVAYDTRLAEGIRAEDYQNVTPSFYRMPEDAGNLKQYLLDTWNESNTRVLNTLEEWTEAELDGQLLPHPALGTLTVRETLFFTVYHNTLHWRDIQRVSGQQASLSA